MPTRSWLAALAFAFACDASAPPPTKTTSEATTKLVDTKVDAKVDTKVDAKVDAKVEPTPDTKVEPTPDTKVEPEPKDYGPQAVDMKTFDLKCKLDSDCTLVRPYPCGHCGCSNIPLREKDLDAFNEARNAIRCAPEPEERKRISCGGCPGYTAYCKRGRCSVKVL
ncbi:MAG TPA: hypothetical protein VG755_28500 [Nannocystaceae bacterium]|nr:hypothetical protein [Nannocystaceae bacterium]